MIKLKTTELRGLTLKWGVMMADGWVFIRTGKSNFSPKEFHLERRTKCGYVQRTSFTDYEVISWSAFGPIMEREHISTKYFPDRDERDRWQAIMPASGETDSTGIVECFGPSLRMAAMHCFIASKLGAGIEVPKELCWTSKGEAK